MLSYRAEMRRADQRVAGVPSATLDTAWGTVEYIDDGQEAPVFLSHGVLGGHDNGRDLITWYVGSGYRAITPSRTATWARRCPTTPRRPPKPTCMPLSSTISAWTGRPCSGSPPAGPLPSSSPSATPTGRSRSCWRPPTCRGWHARCGRSLSASCAPLLAGVGAGGCSRRSPRGSWRASRLSPRAGTQVATLSSSVREHLFPTVPKSVDVAFDALVSEPMWNEFPLEDIAVPTLFVHAADDRLAQEYVPPASARIPGSHLVTVAAGGHLFLEHQDQVREAVGPFVDAVAAKV
jgi:pimeloyl-ACP methyl ester carboxylesterase